jgi:hypothetical protein
MYPPPTYIDVDIDFTAKCSNKKLNIKPSTWLDLLAFLEEDMLYAYARSGQASLRVIEGQTYNFILITMEQFIRASNYEQNLICHYYFYW